MKNITNTTKYLAASLAAIVFAVATPAFAQYDIPGYDIPGYDTPNYDITGYNGYGNPNYTLPGYDIPGYDVPTTAYGSGNPSTPVYTVVSTGGYYGGGYAPVYSGGYGYYPYSSTVTSGSFSGGNTYIVPPVYYVSSSTVVSGSYYVPNNYPFDSQLNGSCGAGVTNTAVGGTVTWTASASGGNGFYNFYWTGDEGLGSSGQAVAKTYGFSGVKNATVTITSNGQSITRTCSVNVGVGNQVLAYTDTNPNLQSVYLSDVPYTGAGDVAKVIGFVSMLVLWSLVLAYVFLKRKTANESMLVAVASEGTPAKQAAMTKTLDLDAAAMDAISEYARESKVVLSSDALIGLTKLSRLGKVNAKAVVTKMSQNQWVTVGEADLAKFI